MAIDSVAKRASALYAIGHRKGRLIPDGTIASPDFQNVVGFYVGIPAAVPTVIAVLYFLVNMSVDNREPSLNVDNRELVLSV